MSSTNRGGERTVADFYPSPAWTVLRLLDHVSLPGGRWLEPGAGEGHIIRAVNSMRSDVSWTAAELRPACRPLLEQLGAEVVIGDFTQWPGPDPSIVPFNVALGNPPFTLAQQFIEHALTMAHQVVFLLRAGFLETEKRRGFYEKHGVPDVFILPDRPSFTGDGTDSATYAWMRWERGRLQKGRVSILYECRQEGLFTASER